ncbi:max-binding protein MNT isoform X2 [Parasteatoda tepidariorum]|uniref:max-binding protein MNT isoform X2 n=1 Tax=Parasteatoda tepidariorum TaxID=114398 RepID=UPI00077FCA82|nr:max-binding protein MNT isoform X2 [Parasteatoda tepidariorum]
MSLSTLLEAAKYVEYQAEAQARGEEPHDYYTFSKLCAARKDGVYPTPVEHISPKKPPSLPNSTHSPEESKEKRRSSSSSSGLTKDTSSHQEHSGTGTREVHNKLEKNRRAHLKECFEALKKQLPNMDERKTSNLSILRGALRFIQTLKRKEREYEHDMERLAREKIAFQQRLSTLKKELASHLDHIDVNNYPIPEDDNETTTTASALSKQAISGAQISIPHKEVAAPSSLYLPTLESAMTVESKAPMISTVPSSLAQLSNESPAQTARVFSTGNLHAMAGIFATPHGMQVISQPSGIKVITAPNSIMASTSSVQHISVNHHPHNQIHVLTPSSSASFASSIGASSAKPFSADSLVQVASSAAKGISKPHLVSPLALVSPQAMVGISHGTSGKSLPNSTHLSDLITSSAVSNLSQNSVKGNSVLSGGMAIAMKNNLPSNSITSSGSSPSGMIATLHMSKSHPQVIQSSLASSIITQGGSQVNNGTHHGVSTGIKAITSNPVRNLSHITGIAHVVSQSPIATPVGQLVAPGNHVSAVTPLVGSVSVVSHTGAVHQQSLGKVLASPVLKSVNQINPIPIIQQQFLQQVPVGSNNQSIVKPVVVVSMPNVVPSASMASLGTSTSLVTMNEQVGVRGSNAQK